MSSPYTAAGYELLAVQFEGKTPASLSHAGSRCSSCHIPGASHKAFVHTGNLSQQATSQISQLEAICAE